MKNPITGAAFERKAELGGGYRAVVRDNRTQERTEGPVFQEIGQARFWVRVEIDKRMAGQPWSPGCVYKPYWVINVWTRE